MPLAYVQLVQILTDGLILTTPCALIHSVGPFGVVMGTAVVTPFHSSLRWLEVASRWLAAQLTHYLPWPHGPGSPGSWLALRTKEEPL